MFQKLLARCLYYFFYQRLNRYCYAPTTYVENLHEYAPKNEIEITNIYENVWSDYHATYLADFYQYCNTTPYWIKHELATDTGRAYIAEIPQGRIWTDWGGNMAIIDQKNVLLGELSFQYDDDIGWIGIKENKILLNKPIPFLKKYKGTVFSCVFGGGSNYNYFQWLFDTLQRLHLLAQSPYNHSIDWYYVPNDELPFQKATLTALGIAPHKIISAKENRHIKADNIICTYINRPTGHIPLWQINFLAQWAKQLTQQTNRVGEEVHQRIFISRVGTGTRTVYNQKEFEALLEKYNFTEIVVEELDWLEQVALFRHAKVIIGQHGAGLANIAFCEQATHLIELYHELVINPNFAS
ncbi:MAG: glycosyltransferase family 61 protein, partial [Thermoflexibacteraceae bacterium]